MMMIFFYGNFTNNFFIFVNSYLNYIVMIKIIEYNYKFNIQCVNCNLSKAKLKKRLMFYSRTHSIIKIIGGVDQSIYKILNLIKKK